MLYVCPIGYDVGRFDLLDKVLSNFELETNCLILPLPNLNIFFSHYSPMFYLTGFTTNVAVSLC